MVKGNALFFVANDTQGYENAIQQYDKALSIDPNDMYALTGKGTAFYSQGNYEQSLRYYDRILDIDSRNKDALDGKGNVLSIKAIIHKPYNSYCNKHY